MLSAIDRLWAACGVDALRATLQATRSGFQSIVTTWPRKAASRIARTSADELNYFVQSVSDYAIFTLDLDGLVTSWNVGAERIKGYAAADIIGRSFSLLYPPEDRAAGEPQRALDFALRSGRFETEGWRLRRDGSRFWAHIVMHLVRDKSGLPIGFAKVTRDVTERNEARRALDEAREALFQSQKVEALGQLVGGIAHDFNNLMSAVSGNLELALMRLSDGSSVRPLLVNAQAGAHRGIALTRRMLSFVRRQQLDLEPVNVEILMGGMDELLRHSLRPGIAIKTDIAPGLGLVMADSQQLELALLNLVINARDAMSDGGTITITADEQGVGPEQAGHFLPGLYVRLAVSDTGTGMSEETLARAVEPFYTTKGVGLGTGLGLSMVHGMAEQFGGGLVLRSRKGEGTVAEIWLRLADPGQVPIAATETPLHESVNDVAGAILVVDDDELVLLTTIAMLNTFGYVVFQASTAEQALGIVRREERLNLILTDQVMPHITGLELATIVALERPKLPVALMSGFLGQEAEHKGERPWLAKPFSPAALRRFVAGAIYSG